MAEVKSVTPFNSAIETGVRSLAILVAAYPEAYDLQRLVELDYLTVHSGDVGGPDSLHAPLPLRAGELLVRRDLVERGLLLMISRSFVDRNVSARGIGYRASDSAAPFFALLEADYIVELRQRAGWAVETFGQLSESEIRGVTRGFFEHWTIQFQPPQVPGRHS